MSTRAAKLDDTQGLPKAPSGIAGLDEITGGGLPRGRPTLVCGGAGCGKTLFAMEFLVRGAVQHGEPGVFMAFEETAEERAANVATPTLIRVLPTPLRRFIGDLSRAEKILFGIDVRVAS